MNRKLPTFLIFVALVGLLFSSLSSAQDRPTRVVLFPDEQRAVSPGSRYVLENVASNSGPPYVHTIFLRDRKLASRRKIFEYERHVQILLNPNGESFALSDYAGSNVAVCSVIGVHENVKALSILDDVLKTVPANERVAIQRNDHLYVAAVAWIDAQTLRVAIWGHDSERRKGFSRFYRYDVADGTARVEVAAER